MTLQPSSPTNVVTPALGQLITRSITGNANGRGIGGAVRNQRGLCSLSSNPCRLHSTYVCYEVLGTSDYIEKYYLWNFLLSLLSPPQMILMKILISLEGWGWECESKGVVFAIVVKGRDDGPPLNAFPEYPKKHFFGTGAKLTRT